MDWNLLKTEILQAHLDRLAPQLRWQIGRLGVMGKIAAWNCLQRIDT